MFYCFAAHSQEVYPEAGFEVGVFLQIWIPKDEVRVPDVVVDVKLDAVDCFVGQRLERRREGRRWMLIG